MLTNYLKIAWRNILKNHSSSLINIGGLAIGMTVFILISLWINDELSFNKYFKNYDRIGVAMVSETRDGKIGTTRITGVPMGDALTQSFKDHFKYVIKSTQLNESILSYDGKIFTPIGVYMQQDGPHLFSFNMLSGNRNGLSTPNSIMISSSLANKFFGTKDPLNQIMILGNKSNVVITGVYEDFPQNSELYKVDFIAPWELYIAENKWVQDILGSWRDNFLKTYVQLNDSESFESVSTKIKDVKLNRAEPKVAERKPVVFIQPMSQWHLNTKFENGIPVSSDQSKLIRMYGIIGIFILILAGVNFINLSTARSEKRAMEVGIRKTLGSRYKQLIFQFLSESLLVSFLALLFALGLSRLLLPGFNQISDKQILFPWSQPSFWTAGIIFSIITGILAGLYPAFYLSSFRPIKVLKHNFHTGQYSSWPRKILVTFQFSISLMLIIGTTVVFKQIEHTQNRLLGYEQNGLIELSFAQSNNVSKTDVLRDELNRSAAIKSMAVAGGNITQVWSNNGGFSWKGKDPSMIAYFGTLAVSPDFGRTIGWKILEGRDFLSTIGNDSSSIILNESAVKLMGLKEPIGERIHWETDWRKDKQYQIVGVAKDMIMDSPYEPIKPSVFFLEGYKNKTILRLNPALKVHETISAIESSFKKVFPNAPFTYHFVDDEFGQKFKKELNLSKIASSFAILAILISCLGLFGVASFIAEKRTKELGIRKVLGASIYALWQLLSKEFVIQLLLAFLIAIPFANYFMNKWLQNYSYRTDVPWWIYALSCLGVLFIAIFTISIQTIKAAVTNPVTALRNE